MIGGPILARELTAATRRPRTYVIQTVFLSLLVLLVIPLWPTGLAATSGATVAERGRTFFQWGGTLQLVLLAILAPAFTANAITEEKRKNTLDLILLSSAGPQAVVWGKLVARFLQLAFLLFLTLPLLFALLTLGGIGAATILVELCVLLGFALLGCGVGVLCSTLLPTAAASLVVSVALLAALLVGPLLVERAGGLGARPGSYPLEVAYLSPLYNLRYLFEPARFVATESFPGRWWVGPLGCVGLGLALTWLAGRLLPHVASVERAPGGGLLERLDRLSARILVRRRADPRRAVGERIGALNPIYWRETSVDAVARFRLWWRLNLLVALLLVVTVLSVQDLAMNDIAFHKAVVAALAGLIILLGTVVAATTVSKEREQGALALLATTPVDHRTYVAGKVRGIARNLAFLVALPFAFVLTFVLLGVVHPASLLLLAVAIPPALVASIAQGVLVSLVFTTTFRAIVAGVLLVVLEAALPAVCCLPTFNLPLVCYFAVEPARGLSEPFLATGQTSYLAAMALALLFSAGTQVGYTVVVLSLIQGGFDDYLGRVGPRSLGE